MSDMAPGGVRQSKRVKAGGPAAERTSGVSTRSGKRPQTSQEEVANQQLPREFIETPQSHEDVERLLTLLSAPIYIPQAHGIV